MTSKQHPLFISTSGWAPSGSLRGLSRGQEQGAGKLGSHPELQGRICSQTHPRCWQSSVLRLEGWGPCLPVPACQQGTTLGSRSHPRIASPGLPSPCQARAVCRDLLCFQPRWLPLPHQPWETRCWSGESEPTQAAPFTAAAESLGVVRPGGPGHRGRLGIPPTTPASPHALDLKATEQFHWMSPRNKCGRKGMIGKLTILQLPNICVRHRSSVKKE